MKNTLLTLIAVSSSVFVSYASTIKATNIAGSTSDGAMPIYEINGSTLADSAYKIDFGYYSADPTQSSTDLLSGWNSFTTNSPSNLNGFASSNGFFNFSNAADSIEGVTLDAASPFVGQNVYALLSNSTNDQFIVLKSSVIFTRDTDTGNDEATPNTSFTQSAQVLFGQNLGARSVDFGGGNVANYSQAVAFKAIPEPSSAALAGLAGLAFLARRKRS